MGTYGLMGIEFQSCKMKRVLWMVGADGDPTICMSLISLPRWLSGKETCQCRRRRSCIGMRQHDPVVAGDWRDVKRSPSVPAMKSHEQNHEKTVPGRCQVQ